MNILDLPHFNNWMFYIHATGHIIITWDIYNYLISRFSQFNHSSGHSKTHATNRVKIQNSKFNIKYARLFDTMKFLHNRSRHNSFHEHWRLMSTIKIDYLTRSVALTFKTKVINSNFISNAIGRVIFCTCKLIHTWPIVSWKMIYFERSKQNDEISHVWKLGFNMYINVIELKFR